MPLDRIHEIEARIVERRTKIDEWLYGRSRDVKIPFYASTDLRNAGYKISVVDTNLFPAGFNILCNKFFDHQTDSARRFIEQRFGKVKRVLLLPEAHTRNAGYVDNIAAIEKILTAAGFEVRLGLLAESRDKTVDVRGTQGDVHILHALQRKGDTLSANDFTPDLVLLNNDMTDGPPAILKDLSQPVTPPVEMGWHNRRKDVYFDVLHSLTDEFAGLLDLDPWWLTTVTDIERGVDFQSGEGMDRLAERAARVLDKIGEQYRAHGIDEKPYVFIKHNTGTYGIGVIAVESAEELLSLNRKMRQKMRAGKGNVPVTDVLIQEGVPSTDLINDCTGEPVMYLIGLDLIGGFFRQHCGKSERENLNQSGSTFARLCFRGEDTAAPSDECYRDTCLRTVYGVLAQVAVLAAGHEIRQVAPNAA
ncbi:MAG: glutamate--cysteine ligase [Myxococcota bacterium]